MADWSVVARWASVEGGAALRTVVLRRCQLLAGLALRRWRRITVISCAWALGCVVLGTQLASGFGSATHLIKLTGPGRSLTEPREGAVAATLPDGNVLIAGGYNDNDPRRGIPLSSAEIFNPATGRFSRLAGPGQSTTEPRYGSVAARLPDGKVLIAGGSSASEGPPNPPFTVSSAELFSPATDTFSKLTGAGQSLTEPREGAVAATLPNGEVLIAGGFAEFNVVTSTELFNPATNTFSKLTGPGQSLTEPRRGAVAAALPSGQFLIAGGVEATSAELFNPATDTFSKLTGAGQSPTEEREGAVAATLSSGEVLIAGGYNRSSHFLASAELFNPATDTFSKPTARRQMLTEARDGAVAATLPSRQVLIAGGSAAADHLGFLSSAELLDPAAQAAEVQVLSCTSMAKTSRGKQTHHCTATLLRGWVTVKASPVSAKASLRRAGLDYATGHLLLGDSSPRLVLDLAGHRILQPGTYTLTLRWTTGKTHTSRQRITMR